MTLLRSFLLGAVLLTLPACGTGEPPPSATACETTCDCPQPEAPEACAGEWVCNAAKTCEYSCLTACSGQVSTCPFGAECNGTFCSQRTYLQCP